MTCHSILRAMALLPVILAAAPGATPESATETLDRYLHRNQASCRESDQHVQMDIEASLPKLKKEGTMSGLKVISRSGQVAYRFLRFTGDRLVKNDVIVRFLTAEAQPAGKLGDVGNTRENYKFRYLRTAEVHGGTVYVFQMHPRKKRVGLYKGELWLDAGTAAPLRESGQLVKSPSIFIRRVQFVRDYPEHDPQRASCGQAERMSINVETRIVGNAEMVVRQRPADIGADGLSDNARGAETVSNVSN